MADQVVADPIRVNPDLPTNMDFVSLPIPPLDATIFSDDLTFPDNFFSFDEEGFDITFDDIYLHSDTEEFFNSTLTGSIPIQLSSDPESGCLNDAVSDPESGTRVLNSNSSELGQLSEDRGLDISGFFILPSPNSGDFSNDYSQESGNKSLTVPTVLHCPSPESGNRNPASSHGSGNCGSAGSEALNYPSPDSGNSSNHCMNGVVDQKDKLEELGNSCLLKRKKGNGDVNSESRTSKYPRSNGTDNAKQSNSLNNEDEKKKARLIRNRESAHLSRQRKKHYAEELEDKVRAMHSTIQDLNAKISYIVAENASLRQQMTGAVCPPPVMYPHPPMASMPYPWMTFPPYVVKSQGAQVPLIPIPRLKPQPLVSELKVKAGSKKAEGKTKKVASVSFLGLVFFILLFGGLVPMVNVKYGGMLDAYSGGSNYIGNRFNDRHHGKVLTVNGHVNGTDHNIGEGFSIEKFGAGIHCGRGHVGADSNIEQSGRGSYLLPKSDKFVVQGNASELLVASLYVPRNDKLVKIDGNLIIHSVLASEKAMASRQEPEMSSNKETGLAVALNMAPAISIPGEGRSNGRHPHLYRSPTEQKRALASDKENLKLKARDGKLQQWFREGLAGPMLSSGMCTEVFQFDVAAASGAIVPATPVRNISAEHHQDSTKLNKGRNRRILHGLSIPLPGSAHNITKEHAGSDSERESSHKNNSLSSIVVSVLVDPREAGDGDGDGMIGTKSFSRIFIVVLLDSVKYVTYSCMLPLMGSSHLVTT